MRTVLIPTKLDTIAATLLTENGFTVVQDAKADLMEMAAAHPSTEALIVRSEKVTAEVIDAFPNLKVVIRAGAGYDTIDTKHARRKNVDVMNTPGANANAVAEEVMAMALAALRHVPKADSSVRAGQWLKSQLMGRELYGKTVGIVGLGSIGQLLIRRLAGFECTVLGYDPMISASKADSLGVELTSVAEIFAKADIISLHVPATDETRGMVNRALLSTMKEGAVLINCARAEVINEPELVAVLKERNLVYCADVFSKEGEGEKPVAEVAAVVMPHLGASTEEANFNAAKRAAEQMLAYFERGVANFVVNRALPPGLDETYQVLAYYLSRIARAYLGKEQPTRIESSFYGDLDEYSNFLLGPIALGLSSDFDPLFDYQEAEAFLREKGIDYEKRAGDPSKNYGNSMTVDLLGGQGSAYRRVSVRGTMAEGRAMISRINDFDRLYFDPVGHSVLVEYPDRPGVLAKISAALGDHGINIEDVRAPQDLKSGHSLAVLKVNQPVSDMILAAIAATTAAVATTYVHIR